MGLFWWSGGGDQAGSSTWAAPAEPPTTLRSGTTQRGATAQTDLGALATGGLGAPVLALALRLLPHLAAAALVGVPLKACSRVGGWVGWGWGWGQRSGRRRPVGLGCRPAEEPLQAPSAMPCPRTVSAGLLNGHTALRTVGREGVTVRQRSLCCCAMRSASPAALLRGPRACCATSSAPGPRNATSNPSSHSGPCGNTTAGWGAVS